MSEVQELQEAAMHAAPGLEAYAAVSRLEGFRAGYKAAINETCKMLDESLLAESPHNSSIVAFKQALQDLTQR